jgi:hypothetical protein
MRPRSLTYAETYSADGKSNELSAAPYTLGSDSVQHA